MGYRIAAHLLAAAAMEAVAGAAPHVSPKGEREPQRASAKGSLMTGRALSWWSVLAAAAVAAGAWLRLQQMGAQIVIDDEWHALHKLLRADLLDTLTHLDYADYSIPITVYYRVLRDTIGVSEWSMHAPMLAAGIALVVVAPWLVREWTTARVRATWTVLLAISPLLVYVSRTARPYALTALTGTAAIVAFERWWRGPPSSRRAWGAAYVIATFAGGYLHMTSLAFTLTPFLFFMALSFRDREAVRRLLKMGAITALPLLAAILPPVINDWHMFSAKAGVDSVQVATAYRTAFLFAGAGSVPVAAFIAVCVVAGAERFRRRDRVLAAYLFTVIAVGTVAVIAARPNWIQQPIVFARYLVAVLPFMLLFAAEGVVWLVSPIHRHPAQTMCVAALGVVLVIAGPLPAQWSAPNQFTGHQRYQFDYDDEWNPFVTQHPTEPVPAFYRELARAPAGSLTIIEAPWRLESHYNPHVWYQQVHRQNVRIGMTTPLCGERNFGEYPEGTDGMALANFEHIGRVMRGETRGADFLVMHLKPWTTPPGQRILPPWPDVESCLPAIERALGPPVYRDERIVAFALARAGRP
jgi:hypothetical protein